MVHLRRGLVVSGALAALVSSVLGVIQSISSGSQAASCTLQLNTDGTASNGSSSFNWVAPQIAGIGAQWQVKVDITAGAVFDSGDSTGSWLDLSSARSWTNSSPVSTTTVTIAFRDKATATTRSTQTGVTVQAT